MVLIISSLLTMISALAKINVLKLMTNMKISKIISLMLLNHPNYSQQLLNPIIAKSSRIEQPISLKDREITWKRIRKT